MSDLEKIDDMISAYTGDANHFKKGIIWDSDPEFGDKVRITAIVTGFQMDLGGLGLNKDLGNLVIIDENFVWDQSEHGAEVTQLLHGSAPRALRRARPAHRRPRKHPGNSPAALIGPPHGWRLTS